MLKAVAQSSDGRPILILGLSRRNTELLLEGKPILVNTAEYGIPGGLQVVLLGGETEDAIQEEMALHTKLPKPTPDPQRARPWDNCPMCLYGDCEDPVHQ